MRTYGRINGVWQVIETDRDGNNDAVMIATLAQCLLLSPGESPFFANHGIPAQQSVVTQVYPDYYVARLQSLFSQYFASLTIFREAETANTDPRYTLNVITNRGVALTSQIAY